MAIAAPPLQTPCPLVYSNDQSEVTFLQWCHKDKNYYCSLCWNWCVQHDSTHPEDDSHLSSKKHVWRQAQHERECGYRIVPAPHFKGKGKGKVSGKGKGKGQVPIPPGLELGPPEQPGVARPDPLQQAGADPWWAAAVEVPEPPGPPTGPPPDLGAAIVAMNQRLDEQVAAIEFLQRTVVKLLEMVEGMERDRQTRPRPVGLPLTEAPVWQDGAIGAAASSGAESI